MPADSAEAKFRCDALTVMGNHAEVVNMRLDRTEQTVSRLANSVEKQVENIDQLGNRVSSLMSAIERLEYGVSAMVEEGRAQRETANNLIRLVTE